MMGDEYAALAAAGRCGIRSILGVPVDLPSTISVDNWGSGVALLSALSASGGHAPQDGHGRREPDIPGDLTTDHGERTVPRLPSVFFRSESVVCPYRLSKPLTHRHSLRRMFRCFLSRAS